MVKDTKSWQKHPLSIVPDEEKSYHFIRCDGKDIGYFAWHFMKKMWIYHKILQKRKK